MSPRALSVAVVALAVIVWAVPVQLLPWMDYAITDIPVYRAAGERITGGDIPYRDFALEYPPLAAGLFALAAVVPLGYGAVFSGLMLACLVAVALAAVATARALDLSRPRQAAAGVAVAVSPLVIGNLVETRYDLLLAALLAWMVWAMAVGRFRLGWGLLAAAALVKLVPLVLAPVLAVHVAHRVGWRRALGGLAGALGAVAAVVAPFALLAPGGTWDVAQYHLERPLQIESLGAAYLLALHALADIGLSVENSFGSQGLAGDGARVVAAIQTALLVVLVMGVAVAFARALRRGRRSPVGTSPLGRVRPLGEARLMVAAVAATLAALLVGGKVLSPQFLLWLLPVGLLVAGRFGRVAVAGTLAAMALTQAYFPHRYFDLVALEPLPIWLLVARDAMLVALLAAVWPRREVSVGTEARELGRVSVPGGADRAVSARYLAD